MKRILYLIGLIAVICGLFGCTQQETVYISPVDVYYCKETITYNTENGVIASETREFSGWEGKNRDFLNLYLSGTRVEDLVSPFPVGAWIIKMDQTDTDVTLLLNSNFSRLTPSEFTLSCACLSMTVMELTGIETVNIQLDGTKQDNNIIIMTKDSLSFADDTLIK